MKLHFEDNLDYQTAAVEAVANLFGGQETCRTEFTVTTQADPDGQLQMGFVESELGIGNRLKLLDDEILENLKKIPERSKLKTIESQRQSFSNKINEWREKLLDLSTALSFDDVFQVAQRISHRFGHPRFSKSCST